MKTGWFDSAERRWDGVEFVAVAKALKVDPIELFTRECRPQDQMDCPAAVTLTPSPRINRLGRLRE